MSRFILSANGQELTRLNTMHQVRTYLDRSVPDVTEVEVHELTGIAVRNAWKIEKSSKRNPAASKLVSENIRSTDRAPYKPWSTSDDNKMLRMKRQGNTSREVGAEIGRTPQAVNARHYYITKQRKN